ncbi:hypothetical protein COB55_02215 [Candidatus Wolfebacteria bacterium]|nr:MAG: hypothetical protein COB55_02215 [Candidatus Wolfebacteria bacterium]
MKTSFTKHALRRVSERLSLSEEDIGIILDSNRVHPVGRDRGSSRVHKLFYSTLDDLCFVAIQDEETGKVITVLPIDYHNRWRISLEVQQQARDLIKRKIEIKKFRLSANVEGGIGNERRTINLGTIKKNDYGRTLEIAAENPEVRKVAEERLSGNIRHGEHVTHIFIRKGRKGIPVLLSNEDKPS